jgi:nitrite reductase/ring-hydroxylating ferredoxin subunit
MSSPRAGFIKVANVTEIPAGGSRAFKLDEQQSIALFNVDGRIYALGCRRNRL